MRYTAPLALLSLVGLASGMVVERASSEASNSTGSDSSSSNSTSVDETASANMTYAYLYVTPEGHENSTKMVNYVASSDDIPIEFGEVQSKTLFTLDGFMAALKNETQSKKGDGKSRMARADQPANSTDSEGSSDSADSKGSSDSADSKGSSNSTKPEGSSNSTKSEGNSTDVVDRPLMVYTYERRIMLSTRPNPTNKVTSPSIGCFCEPDQDLCDCLLTDAKEYIDSQMTLTDSPQGELRTGTLEGQPYVFFNGSSEKISAATVAQVSTGVVFGLATVAAIFFSL